MAELADSEPLENLRNPCPEHSESGRKPVKDDSGLGFTSPSEVQVSLLLAGDSSPAPARLSVTSRNIVFEVAGKRFTRVELLLLDLLGALVLPKDDGSCALQLHTFAYSKMTRRGLVPAPGRTHEVFTVFFTHQGEAPANSRATAEQWKASLLRRCSQRCRDIFVHEPPLHRRQQGEVASFGVCKLVSLQVKETGNDPCVARHARCKGDLCGPLPCVQLKEALPPSSVATSSWSTL